MPLLFFENKFSPKAKQAPNYPLSLSFSKTGMAYASNGTFYAESTPEKGSDHHYRPTSKETVTLREWIFRTFGDDNPVEYPYEPGTYYKRISRPGGPFITTSIESINQSFVALRILLDKLQTLFDTVEPHPDNTQAYGHKIRELLLLACMEVESSWSAVLKENNYPEKRWSTRDYFKLKKAMFLDGYKMGLANYHAYPAFQPFKDWDGTDTTRSLPWYDAYNKTKHDREENLNLATLGHTISAVGPLSLYFLPNLAHSLTTLILIHFSRSLEACFGQHKILLTIERSSMCLEDLHQHLVVIYHGRRLTIHFDESLAIIFCRFKQWKMKINYQVLETKVN